MAKTTDVCALYERWRTKFNFTFALKEGQKNVLTVLLDSKDSVGIFPTGYGKSVCFMLFPLLLDAYQGHEGHVCRVLSPLKRLMFDQCRKALDYGISAVRVFKNSDMDPGETEGEFRDVGLFR